MSVANFDPNAAENSQDIEKQFSVKVVKHIDAYWGLLEKIPGSKLKLTRYDDEIFETLLQDFPEFESPDYAKNVNEDEMKSLKGKERWRAYIEKFNYVEDYNFGTIMRANSDEEYSETGTIFVVRMQFYAIEICRNRYGLNDWVVAKNA